MKISEQEKEILGLTLKNESLERKLATEKQRILEFKDKITDLKIELKRVKEQRDLQVDVYN